MRPILAEIGPLPLWVFVAAIVALFVAMGAIAAREARQGGSSPKLVFLGYLAVGALVVAAAFHFRQALNQPIPFRAYGTMLMLAFVTGISWCSREAKRRDIDPAHVLDLSFLVIIASIVVARILYVLLDLKAYSGSPDAIVRVWQGGLSFHGGLLGAIIAIALFTHARKIPFWKMADLLAPGAALGYGIARIGCFLNGCCYGIPTKLPWGVQFIPGDLPRHPTQIYSALASFAIFGMLLVWRKRPLRDGQLMMAYLGLYSIYRFGMEFLRREATAKVWIGGLTEAQIASLCILLLAAIAYCWIARRARQRELESLPPVPTMKQ